MAKLTKLQIELNKPKKDWLMIQKLINKNQYQDFSKVFMNNKNQKFRKLLVANRFGYMELTEEIVNELKKSTYKEDIETYMSDGRRSIPYKHEEQDSIVELVNHHKAVIATPFYTRLNYNGDIYNGDPESLKKYLLSHLNEVSDSALNSIIDDLGENDCIKLMNRNQFRGSKRVDSLKKLVSKVTFEKYFNSLSVQQDKKFVDPDIFEIYGPENCLDTLLKTNDNFEFSWCKNNFENKVKLNEEQTIQLIKKSKYSSLCKFYELADVDELFCDKLNNVNNPEELKKLSDKINKFILDGKGEKLANNHFNWKHVDLSPEAAKIMFKLSKKHKDICSFHHLKPYLTKEEYDKIINNKQNVILYLHNKIKAISDDLKKEEVESKSCCDEHLDDKQWQNCNCCCYRAKDDGKRTTKINKMKSMISKIVYEYTIPSDFLLSLIKIDDAFESKMSQLIVNQYLYGQNWTQLPFITIR